MGEYHVCYVLESRDVTPCGQKKGRKYCTNGVQNINKRRTMHHVDLTNMGKFYVGNVNESRDVAPCGGLCPNFFIEVSIFPHPFVRFNEFWYP